MTELTDKPALKFNQFEVVSGEVVVSDPCYKLGTWCQGVLTNVKKGIWVAEAEESDQGSWGKRVAALHVHHVDHPSARPWEGVSFEVGVDSGQAGVFDKQHYRDNKVAEGAEIFTKDYPCVEDDRDDDALLWYNLCCDRTLGHGYPLVDGKTEDEVPDVIPFGAVVSSGFGDGSYRCTVDRSGGEIVAIDITFIDEEEEVDEEDDYDDYDDYDDEDEEEEEETEEDEEEKK